MNTAASDSVIETMVKPISFEPVQRRLDGGFPHLHVPDDVLQHDDGVVHHESDRQRQRHQREVVQAVPEQVHHREGADDRQRQRQAGDHGRRQVPQEQEDHQDHQARASGRSVNFTSLTESWIDIGPVVEDVEVDRGRQLLLEGRAAGGAPRRPPRRCWSPAALKIARMIERSVVVPGRGLVVFDAVDRPCRGPPAARAGRRGRRR